MSQVVTHAFNWVDYFIIAVIIVSTFISLMRGFISEAISLLTWVVAAVIAFKAAPLISNYFVHLIQTPSLRFIVSFLIVFIFFLIIGALVNHFLSVFILTSGLSGTNRLLGMLFGFARGVLLIAIFILFARYTSVVKESWWHSSQLVPYFMGITNWLQQFLPDHLNNVSHFFVHPKLGSS